MLMRLFLLMHYNMKNLFALMLVLLPTFVFAKKDNVSRDTAPEMNAQYKYQVVVESQSDAAVVMSNGLIDQIVNESTSRGLFTAVAASYLSSVAQKTVNATSNLLSLGVSYLAELIRKPSKDFQSWSEQKRIQCTYTKDLSSNETIDDFYYRPSVNGALDPRDLKFKGFSCANFIEMANSVEDCRMGQDVFYISCKLRTDSLGISHMINHSKFLLEVDSLLFNPTYCNVPNTNQKQPLERFSFEKYTDLKLKLKVKLFSSWINEAIMVTSDCQLGEFEIDVAVKPEVLQKRGEDNLFVYGPNCPDNKDLICVTGDSFIVPRSFVGTSAEPVWGTGQYRLAIEVSQSCLLNAEYYIDDEYIDIVEVGNGKAVNFANLPGYKVWDKAIWKEEWRMMNKRKKSDSFLSNAWKEIKTAYIGTNWVKELVDPAATVLLDYEATELQSIFNLNQTASVTKPAKK